MSIRQPQRRQPFRSRGLSLIEMMVTVLIGAFLMIGVIAIFGQTRTTYRTNDTVERLQENVRFALNALQPDIRFAGNWGLHSVDEWVTPPAGVVVTCAENGANVSAAVLRVASVESSNNTAALLPCPAFGGAAQAGTDVLVVRHAGGQTTAPTANVIQIQSDRLNSAVFDDGAAPSAENCPAPPAQRVRCTYDLQVHYYYVAASSSVGAGVPSLRRKTLINGVLTDQELIAGVEDFQVQLGINTGPKTSPPRNNVDRYVNAPDLVTPGSATFDIDAYVLAVRVWLMFRAEIPEVGFVDGATYNYADVANFTPGDTFRRALVNKTIMLRNGWETDI